MIVADLLHRKGYVVIGVVSVGDLVAERIAEDAALHDVMHLLAA